MKLKLMVFLVISTFALSSDNNNQTKKENGFKLPIAQITTNLNTVGMLTNPGMWCVAATHPVAFGAYIIGTNIVAKYIDSNASYNNPSSKK